MRHASSVDAKTLTILLFELDLFPPHEAKQQDDLSKEHDWESEPALKCSQCHEEKEAGQIMWAPDMAEGAGDGKGCAM